MGKKKGNKGFTLRFANEMSPATTMGFNPAVQLQRMFPDVDNDVIHDVLCACRQDVEGAANTLIEMGLVRNFEGPSLSLSEHPNPKITSAKTNDEDMDSLTAAKFSGHRRSDSSILSLPPDMLLKLFGYFRAVDLVSCSRCCRDWLSICSQLLDAVLRLDLMYPTNRYNLSLLASCPRVASIKVSGIRHQSLEQ